MLVRSRHRPDHWQHGLVHLIHGKAMLRAPDGTVLFEDPEWMPNIIHNEGESSIITVFLKAGANPQKYLEALNQGAVTELSPTDTMATVTESETAGSNGYARPEITTGEWGSNTLNASHYQTTAVQQSLGTKTNAGTWSVSHMALVTAATGTAGLLLVTIPLTAVQTVTQGVELLYTPTIKVRPYP